MSDPYDRPPHRAPRPLGWLFHKGPGGRLEETPMTDTTDTTDAPAPRWIVCPRCEGEGTIGPGIVWTAEEADEDPDYFDGLARSLRSGMHDLPCPDCDGMRVVSPAMLEEARERAEAEAEMRAEMRFGA